MADHHHNQDMDSIHGTSSTSVRPVQEEEAIGVSDTNNDNNDYTPPTRQSCLETAKQLLLRKGGNDNNDDHLSISLFLNDVRGLTQLFDDLCVVIDSVPSPFRLPSSFVSASLSSNSDYYFHKLLFLLRRGSVKHTDDRGNNNNTTNSSRNYGDVTKMKWIHNEILNDMEWYLQNELDLYRILCIVSIILRNIIIKNNNNNNNSNMTTTSKKKSFDNKNNNNNNVSNTTSSSQPNTGIVDQLNNTINKCNLLIEMLVSLIDRTRRGSIINEGEGDVSSLKEERGSEWKVQLQRWLLVENQNNDDHDDDGDEMNLLSISKEQLEEEEKELIKMASTPTPSERHGKTTSTTMLSSTTQKTVDVIPTPACDAPASAAAAAAAANEVGAASMTKRNNYNNSYVPTSVLNGRLVLSEIEVPSIRVRLDEMTGIIHLINDYDYNNNDDGNEDVASSWAITTPSEVRADGYPGYGATALRIRISNLINIQTGELYDNGDENKNCNTMVLDVPYGDFFGPKWDDWLVQVGTMATAMLRTTRHEQEEVLKLWSRDDVKMMIISIQQQLQQEQQAINGGYNTTSNYNNNQFAFAGWEPFTPHPRGDNQFSFEGWEPFPGRPRGD